MQQEKLETLMPINAVSPCRSVHIPHYCCFRTQRPKPLVKGQKCSAHQQRHSSAHDVCRPPAISKGSDESLDMLETMTRSSDAALICLRGRVNIPGPLLLCL
ncbi:hypothetical protein R3I93_005492 [Phoxinus phoxinus]|uniref:Uncharacterized protein n=1 Tax=Phoxinus phoxinus TaxID=58324 RepID=A0AAN9DEF4_9TELE